MSLQDDLTAIEEIGEKAWKLACCGKQKEALQLIRPLRRSMYVSEAERIIALVEARLHLLKGDRAKAKARIRHSLGYLWASVDAYAISREGNPPVTSKSREYRIELLGGIATIGCFTQFTDEHIAAFDVVANSEQEAMKYIDEWCHFAEPENRKVLSVTCQSIREKVQTCGIVRCYPFRLNEAEPDVLDVESDDFTSDIQRMEHKLAARGALLAEACWLAGVDAVPDFEAMCFGITGRWH